MDRLTALKIFCQVVERGSFVEASRHLGLSPAAISKNIGELEEHLTVRLLNRTTRRMSVTEAGMRYYERISRILDDLAEADRTLGPLQNMPSGVLRVSAPMTWALTLLSPAIPRFLDRYPDLSLDLQLEDRRIDIIKDGYDIAIRGSDNLEDSSLIARKIMTMPHVVCGAPSYFTRHGIPETPTDLKNHNCIQFTLSGHANEWEFKRANRSVRVPINGRYKVTSSLAVRDALHAGLGISLIPLLYVREDLEQGRLRTVLHDWTAVETSIYAVYPAGRHVAAKVRVFVDFLIEELSASLPG